MSRSISIKKMKDLITIRSQIWYSQCSQNALVSIYKLYFAVSSASRATMHVGYCLSDISVMLMISAAYLDYPTTM